jgi:hypothetical protein
VRELLHSNAFFGDDSWTTLYLEFVLYSRRNPEAAAKLAASAQRTRELVTEMVDTEYASVGIDRMVDPTSVTDALMDTVLMYLYNSMGVDIPADPADAAPTP